MVIEVYSNWAPLGAKRFVELVRDGYYDRSPVFRVAKVFFFCFFVFFCCLFVCLFVCLLLMLLLLSLLL